jgi:hypothetical protein
MFIWDFSALVAVILIIGVGLVLSLWIIYNLNRDKGAVIEDSCIEFFRHCRYCGYVYLDYRRHEPCRCPRCASYHD